MNLPSRLKQIMRTGPARQDRKIVGPHLHFKPLEAPLNPLYSLSFGRVMDRGETPLPLYSLSLACLLAGRFGAWGDPSTPARKRYASVLCLCSRCETLKEQHSGRTAAEAPLHSLSNPCESIALSLSLSLSRSLALSLSLSLSLYIYIYIYIYMDRHIQRETEIETDPSSTFKARTRPSWGPSFLGGSGRGISSPFSSYSGSSGSLKQRDSGVWGLGFRGSGV